MNPILLTLVLFALVLAGPATVGVFVAWALFCIVMVAAS